MAILKGGLFGDVTGKLNNLVVRKVKGNFVVTVRPKKYRKTKSKKAKYIRSRFSIAVEFSKYINSIPQLKAVWNAANKKCFSAFNMIEQYNIKLVNDNSPSIKNIITPDLFTTFEKECEFPFTDFYFNNKILSGELDHAFNFKQFMNDDKYFLIFVFSFFNPKDKAKKFYALDSIVYTSLSFNNMIELNLLALPGSIKKKASLYNNVIIYAASVLTGLNRKQTFCSPTRSKEFSLS